MAQEEVGSPSRRFFQVRDRACGAGQHRHRGGVGRTGGFRSAGPDSDPMAQNLRVVQPSRRRVRTGSGVHGGHSARSRSGQRLGDVLPARRIAGDLPQLPRAQGEAGAIIELWMARRSLMTARSTGFAPRTSPRLPLSQGAAPHQRGRRHRVRHLAHRRFVRQLAGVRAPGRTPGRHQRIRRAADRDRRQGRFDPASRASRAGNRVPQDSRNISTTWRAIWWRCWTRSGTLIDSPTTGAR